MKLIFLITCLGAAILYAQPSRVQRAAPVNPLSPESVKDLTDDELIAIVDQLKVKRDHQRSAAIAKWQMEAMKLDWGTNKVIRTDGTFTSPTTYSVTIYLGAK